MTRKEFVVGLRRAAVACMAVCTLAVAVHLVMGVRSPFGGRPIDYAIHIVFWVIGFVVFRVTSRKLREMSASN